MYYILAKEDCVWCDKAKQFLKDNNEDFVVYDYKEHPMIVKLMFEAVLKTVPQIWYNNMHIGGYEALVDWHEDAV